MPCWRLPIRDSTAIREVLKGCIRNRTFSVHLGWANRAMTHWISTCYSLVPQFPFCLYPFCACDSLVICTAPNASSTTCHHVYIHTHTHTRAMQTQPKLRRKYSLSLIPSYSTFEQQMAALLPFLLSSPPSSGCPCRQRFLRLQPSSTSKSCSFPLLLGFWYYPSLQVIAR